ncbi:MAG: hypothetical protein M1831_004169 [Alyxoria varia]|nr:MAG: hypothetical protein M1831_004169 [Alyxoria varia]
MTLQVTLFINTLAGQLRENAYDAAKVQLASLTALVVLASWLAWQCKQRTPLLRSKHLEPRTVPAYYPYIGHAISLFLNYRATLISSRHYVGNPRDPFYLLLNGAYTCFVTDPTHAAAIHRAASALTHDHFLEQIARSFGVSQQGWNRLVNVSSDPKIQHGDSPSSKPSRKPLVHQLLNTFRQHLSTIIAHAGLQKAVLQQTARHCSWNRLTSTRSLPCERSGHTVQLGKWVRDAFSESGTKALFGDTLQRIEPHFIATFNLFDEESWKNLYSVPGIWRMKNRKAVKKIQADLTSYFSLPWDQRSDASSFVREIETRMSDCGMTTDDIAAFIALLYWGTTANAWKACFWCVAHIAADQELLRSIRLEAQAVIRGSFPPVEMAIQLKTRCPKLVAVYNEVLRFYSASGSARKNLRPITLYSGENTTVIPAGTNLAILCHEMHMDAQSFGDDAAVFRADRFLENGNIMARSGNFKPFGDGFAQCPGQYLAQAQVLLFAALTIVRLEIEPIEGEGGKVPEADAKTPSFGILVPQKGQDMEVVVTPRD